MKFPPGIEIVYDDKYGFLLSVFFQIMATKTKMREKELMAIFNDEMKKAGVYNEFDSSKDALSRRLSIVGPPEEEEAKGDDAEKAKRDDDPTEKEKEE